MEGKVKAIEIALENELRERNFYLEHSRRTGNQVGKQMFASLAEDEDEHYRRLKTLHQELSRQGRWPESISLVVNDTNIREVLKNIDKLAEKTAEPDADDRKAIGIAIEFETKGHSFYSRMRDSAETAEEKDFFGRLAEMEREHLSSLKDTLLFFDDPATWYEQREKPHFEG